MSDAAAITMFVVGFSVAASAGWCWMSRTERKNREGASAAAEAFQERLAIPDFQGLETHLGQPLPASFRALHEDRDLITSDGLLVGVPNPVTGDDECYVAWFQPADLESLDAVWPGCEGLLPIANSGTGDQFLIDPKQPDPEVAYHLHESGKTEGTGVTLSAFIAARRRPVPNG